MSLHFPIASLAFELLACAVAPPRCAACDSRVPILTVFCGECVSTVVSPEDAERNSIAAFGYGGAVAQAISRLKYQRRPDIARPLGDLLRRSLEPRAAELSGGVVVPVPLHPSRLAERGFNQAALIARRVARGLDATLLPLALARLRHSPPQATLDRAGRVSNLLGAFRTRQPERVCGRTVLLVDDVRTTGATLEACTSALIDAGARSVMHGVVARVPAGV